MPNDHECGTYFWTRIIRELLWTQEALIIPMNGKYYKASAWQVYIVGENDYSKKCERVLVWLARFKHVDVVDSAVNLDKLRGIGFSYDELREMVGYPLLNTDFSQARALTKNYAEEGQNEKTEELI